LNRDMTVRNAIRLCEERGFDWEYQLDLSYGSDACLGLDIATASGIFRLPFPAPVRCHISSPADAHIDGDMVVSILTNHKPIRREYIHAG
jgi:hypothetical protein